MVRHHYSVAVPSTRGRLHPSLLRREGLGERWSPLWKEGRGDFRRFLIDFIKVAKNIVVIKQLPQPNPLIHQMREDISHLEDEIEFHCRNRNLPLFTQHHPMRELLLLHPLIIFLKFSVMPEAQQEARPIMHFHLHTLIRWELDVVIARLFMRRDRADKGDEPLAAPFHPDINITRRAIQAIGKQQRIPLPFQNAGSESLLPEPLRNLDGSIVQPHIRNAES